MDTKLKESVSTLIEELNKDKSEGSYYYSWQANIAMAFVDEFYDELEEQDYLELGSLDIAKIANNAAKRFLDQLTHKTEDDKL